MLFRMEVELGMETGTLSLGKGSKKKRVILSLVFWYVRSTYEMPLK